MNRKLQVNLPDRGFCHLQLDGKTITAVDELGEYRPGALCCWSGLTDIQINGFAGVDFSDAGLDPQRLAKVLEPLLSTGVTCFFPTLTTNALDALIRQLKLLEQTRNLLPLFASCVLGYHLEGPWLSPGASHGAHDPAFMGLPSQQDFERLQEAGGGRIRLLTLAPELAGAVELIERITKTGVRCAIGHTDGSAYDVHRAVAAGATMATHLGNGCPQKLDRHSAPFWAQLANDNLVPGLICDGFHLTSEMIKIISRVKGKTKCCLITDAIAAALMPPGIYRTGVMSAELLTSGQVVRLDRASMAGSSLTMNRAVAHFRRAASCTLSEALQAASQVPRQIMGYASGSATLSAGDSADLILFEENEESLSVRETIVAGETVWACYA